MTSAPPAVKRLAILAPNWLGDAVMALPAVGDVRRAWPAAELCVAARPSVGPLFEMVPGVRVVSLAAGRSRAAAIAALTQGAFDAALLLPNSLGSALAAWQAGIPERWGYRTDCRGRLLTRAPEPPREHLHQAAYYRHLTRALGFEAMGSSEPRIVVPEHARSSALVRLREAGWTGNTPLVALAPGAAYGGAKRWPAASFASLADGFADDGVQTVVVGSAADAAAGREMRASLQRAHPIDLIGQTDLPALAGVLSHCQGIVTNDSGAMHLAAALGVRVTALFGPTDDRATFPLGPDHVVLTHRTWCRPCMLRECPLTHECMRGIGVGTVLSAARRAL